MPKNINLKIDQTTYEIIILQNKIPYISRGLTRHGKEGGVWHEQAGAAAPKSKLRTLKNVIEDP